MRSEFDFQIDSGTGMTTDNEKPGQADQNGDAMLDTATIAGDAPPAGNEAENAAKEETDFRDRWLRALAEMENLRRRTEREVADARSYGIAGFARDMIGIADNMRRALASAPPELHQSKEAGVKPLVEGVELTDRELAKVLEKHGVRRLEPMGQKFDPHFHQAMFEVPDPSVPAGTVVQVVQDGYTIGERVLRPALVGVAKGGPKAAASNSGEGSEAPAQG
jgi:molecular chaperone GrpE